MNNDELDGKISVKRKQIEVETDSKKKYKMQQELQVLNLKKQIKNFGK